MMIKKETVKKTSTLYIFIIIAICILIGSFWIYNTFKNTSTSIETADLKSNIEYIDNITDNITSLIKSHLIKDSLYTTLKNNKELRTHLEDSLSILITKRYRYIYIVDKTNNSFRFLLDGSKNPADKSEFAEPYEPLDIDKWNEVYRYKKTIYFTHNDIKSIWLTYLKPIIIDNKVIAILAIDFSLEDHKVIIKSLKYIDDTLTISLIFTIFIFFIIIIFAYIDNKRVKELRRQSLEILLFNKTLQSRVKEEVDKNREKDKQLLQQSRLAQMGEMISMIAHQWRQPLASISSTSMGLQVKARLNKLDNETVLDLASKISKYTQHLSTTIDDFRDFFKANKEKRETTFDELISSVLSIVEVSLVNKNIELKKDLQSDKIFFTYPNELKQVILNLIKNAEDILLEKNIQNPYISITTKDGTLTVSDNGGGIPDDIIDNIFDPYFSTKMDKNGTGLGLYMSKTIVEEHCRGILSVHNDKNGAVFTIDITKEIRDYDA